MVFLFTCPHCGAETLVEESLRGRRGPCRQCRREITVQAGQQPPAPVNPINAALTGGVGGAALFGLTVLFTYVLPTLYSSLNISSGWMLVVLLAPPVIGLVITAAAGGFTGGVYFGVLSALLDQHPRAVRAALGAALAGYVLGAVLTWSGSFFVYYQLGGMVTILASMMRIMTFTLVGGSAGAFLGGLIAGLANMPRVEPWKPPRDRPADRPPAVSRRMSAPRKESGAEILKRIVRQPSDASDPPNQA